MGVDFRIGGYLVAKTFSNATSGYPPVTVVLCLPFTLLSENSAVLLQMAILVLMSVGTAHVAGKLVEATLSQRSR